MLASSSDEFSFTTALADEQATLRLMEAVAAQIESGDTITLSGDLGAGKTTFARAFIRHLASDAEIEVPSPTFTLIQSYDLPRFALVHADFYRLSDSHELDELGFDEFGPGAVTVIEWPDRAGDRLPADRIDIAFTLSPRQGPSYRDARVTGYGAMALRVARIGVMRDFLARAGYAEAARRHMQGDASTRAYERLTRGSSDFVLMNAPRRPDGPPVRDGKPYSAIARLAEDVTPFVAMAVGLRLRGFSAPQIYAADRAAGLVLLEDLGTEPVVSGDPPVPIAERYEIAADLLAALHAQKLPNVLPVEPGVEYTVPPYDMDALLIETDLLLDWYLPKLGAKVSNTMRKDYAALWRDALRPQLAGPQAWVLRDYHSPNLLWLPQRRGIARIGLLDFQDAVMGPPAYDLGSLLQDARVDVPEKLEIALLARYTRARRLSEPGFDAPVFVQSYATMSAQRASKILGIFARLEKRDGKPQYLRHIPRVWGYLQRSLAHPALADLKSWYRLYVPALK